ncbi:MAG: hypothetical protein JNM95_12510 [Chitinophagaceae bacterium]|nr:hypothetical protein [Chitinophagaceae bacterium]
MTRILLLSCILFCLLNISGIAQQCGYQNYGILIVKVIDQESGLFVHDLKLSLVFGDDQDVEARTTTLDDNSYCSEPYLFWENKSNSIPNQRCKYTKLFRQSWPTLGNSYLCVVPLESVNYNIASLLGFNKNFYFSRRAALSNKMNALNDSLFWHIRIEGKRKVETSTIRIPLHAAIDLCGERVNSTNAANNLNIARKTITLIRTKNKQIKLANSLTTCDYFILPLHSPVHDEISDSPLNTSKGISKILVVHDSDLTITQTIEPSSEYPFFTDFEFLAWQNERIKKERVFRILETGTFKEPSPTSRWRYFHFNKLKRMYEPFTVWNNMDSVRHIDETSIVVGFKSVDSITTVYHWNDTGWVSKQLQNNTARNREKRIESEAMEPKQELLRCESAKRNKPLQYFEQQTKLVTDTFWIINYGNTESRIELYPSKFYSFLNSKNDIRKKDIQPNEKVGIRYQRQFEQETRPTPSANYVKQPLEFIDDFCMISYANKSITLSMSYPIVKEGTAIELLNSKELHCKYVYLYSPFPLPNNTSLEYHVTTDSNGFIKSYGKKLSNGTKIGTWVTTQYNHSGEFLSNSSEQASKILTLHLQNERITTCTTQVVNLWSSYSLPPDTNWSKNANSLTITVLPTISYILISNENGQVQQKIRFNQLEEYSQLSLHLLKPNEAYYSSFGIKIPIKNTEEIYRLNWNAEHIKSLENELSKVHFNYQTDLIQSLNQHLAKLKKRFPKLSFGCDIQTLTATKFNKNVNYLQVGNWELNLSECDEKDRIKIKQLLESDTTIASVCYLLDRENHLYSDGQISIKRSSLNPVLSKGFKDTMSLFGFSNYQLNQAFDFGETYRFNYQSKIIDRHFFDQYNQLVEKFPELLFGIYMQGREVLVEPSDINMETFKE